MPALAAAFPRQPLSLRLVLDVALPLVTLAAILWLPRGVVQYAVIVGGQSHFLMAYLYQYRAGGMTIRYLVFAALLAVLTAAYVFLVPSAIPIFLFANMLFSLHFAYDEYTLHGETFTRTNAVTTVLFALVTISPFVAHNFPAFTFMPAVALGLMLSWFAARLINRKSFSHADQYLAFLTVLLALVAILVPLERAWTASWFLIVFLHYLNWLFVYGWRVRSVPERRTRYWLDTAVVTGAVLALFAVFYLGEVAALGIFFAPLAFQFWTAAHVLLSVPAFRSRR